MIGGCFSKNILFTMCHYIKCNMRIVVALVKIQPIDKIRNKIFCCVVKNGDDVTALQR